MGIAGDKQQLGKPASFFREEAVAHFRASRWQPPLLSKPMSGAFLSVIVLVTTMALVVFATTFQFARKESVTGYLTPTAGWSRVSAQSFGVVRRLLVEAGDYVESGAVLYELAPTEGFQAGLSVEAKLLEEVEGRRAALEARLVAVDGQFENNLDLHQNETAATKQQIVHLEAEIGSQEARLSIAQHQYRDGQRLQTSGVLAEADMLELSDRVQSLSAVVAAARRELAQFQSVLDSSQIRLARLEHEHWENRAAILDGLHALAMEESGIRARDAVNVLAPRTGLIGSVRAEEGDWIRPGYALLDILPNDTELLARLFVHSVAMGAVEVGQEVRVYLDAFPYEQHGTHVGRILSISETTLSPLETGYAGSTSAQGTPLFRIDVEFPDGFNLSATQSQSLRPGMTVTADLVRDYGTLIDWLIEPLWGAARRL